jgi:NADH-quinone oxidoreductase subunit L
MYYARPELPARMTAQVHSLYAVLKNKYWVDELYGVIIVAPVLFVARWILGVLVERGIIDGGTLTAGYTAQGLGALVARIQSGNIRSYAGWLALFAALVLAASYFGWTAHFLAR